jgi:sulfite exporter TauE/SafE
MSPWFDSFVFGAANSLHCAGMCGPLALAFQGGNGPAVAWHLGRLVSYAAIGLVLGGLGGAMGAAHLGSPAVALVLAAGLVVLALVGERGALSIPGLAGPLQRVLARTRGSSALWRASVLGLLTPLLPCGLLWAACSSAAIAGDSLAGGAVMAGFALGSLPLLVVAQTQIGSLSRRLGPTALRVLQKAAMLSAAGLLVWRALAAMHGNSCCHG